MVRLGYYPPCVADYVPVLSIGFVPGLTLLTDDRGPLDGFLCQEALQGRVASARPLSVGSIPFRCREDGFGFARN